MSQNWYIPQVPDYYKPPDDYKVPDEYPDFMDEYNYYYEREHQDETGL